MFICAAVLVSLGNFLGFSKSTLIPSRIAKFLGFLVNSELCAFILQADKKETCAALREHVLSNRTVSIKTLQRLAGKISSFCIAVPAARLFAREICRATAGFLKSYRLIKFAGVLKRKLNFGVFLIPGKVIFHGYPSTTFASRPLVTLQTLQGVVLSASLVVLLLRPVIIGSQKCCIFRL